MLSRAGYGHFDDIMEWTPRRIAVVLGVEQRLHDQAAREALALQAMAARGDPKAVQKALKDDDP